MMAEGVRRMDQVFTAAFNAGALQRDSTLNLPPPPPPPPEEQQEVQHAPVRYQVAVVTPNAATYNSALAHLRAVPGVSLVQQVNIGIGDTSYFYVTYRGDLVTLRSILMARGWGADIGGGQLKMYVKTPTPTQQQPQAQPATNAVQPQPQNKVSAAAPPKAETPVQ
jgi:hypothetical protein